MRFPRFRRRRKPKLQAQNNVSPVPLTIDHDQLRSLLARLDQQSGPNLNPLNEAVRNNGVLALNVKTLGYELARLMLAAKSPVDATVPQKVGLISKASTQADMESQWVAYWCSELKIQLVYHRKIWELAYVLQVLYETGRMLPGKRGLGFGCGVEPIASYLAAQDVSVTVTDMPPENRLAAGWASSNEYLAELDKAFHSHLVSRELFTKNVVLRHVDMNQIPTDLAGYDFCWSICALEHLGSIQKGLDFIANAMATLAPGGLAIHTTEYNFTNDHETIDNFTTVLYQKKHFVALAETLTSLGYCVATLDLSFGSKPLDRFIDLPPFGHDLQGEMIYFANHVPHMKVSVDGFPSTCFGLIIQK